jgi:flagellar biosynthesis chaperone FliJ
MKTNHDRGMKAVARVREVRERDSRIGLLQALETVRQREERLAELQRALTEAQDRETGSVDDFVVARSLLTSMAVAVREAERSVETARTIATEAQSRWQSDKARLRAIRHLIKERALQRAEHVRRAEVREIDDIVGSLHARKIQNEKAAS